jgi:hypothetical protein
MLGRNPPIDVGLPRRQDRASSSNDHQWTQSAMADWPNRACMGCIMVKRLFITCRDALEIKGIKEDSSDYPQSPRANSAPPPHW